MLIFITTLVYNNIVSQESISIGIKGGIGYSQYFFQKYIEQKFVQVFQKGIVIGHRDNKNFGIQLEILSTQKAWEEEIGTSFTKRVVIDYIEFPLLSSYKIGRKRSSLIILAGLHFASALNVDSLNMGQLMEGDSTIVPYQPFDYNKTDYGINGGIAYQCTLGRNIIQLEVMYSQSMQNLFGRDYTRIYRSLNQGLYVNLVYKISLAGKPKLKIEKNP
jgi:hypothetical protein